MARKCHARRNVITQAARASAAFPRAQIKR